MDIALTLSVDSALVVGSTVRVTATATAAGTPLDDPRFAFTSSDTAVVAVRGPDSLFARSRGAVDITVRLVSSLLPGDAPSVTARVHVVVGSVVAESSTVTFASLGDTLRVAAIGLDATGSLVAALPRWSSTDTTRVRVDSLTGRMTARGNGTAEVIAALDGKADTVAVTVQQVLARYTFSPAAVFLDALAATQVVTATGRDARDNPMAGVPPVFTADDATIVLVGAASGAVTSLLNGQTVVRATRGGVTDSFQVTVAQRATSVFIQPAPIPPLTSIGQQVQLSVRAFDRNAVEIQGATPAWFTLDPQRITVSSAGLVTAQAVGNADVIASLGGVNDTSSVTVTNDPVVVAVTPDTATATSVGDTVVFAVAVTNGIGAAIANAGVSWRTPDTTIVRVLPDGRTITLATGFARVIAQAGLTADTGFVISTNQVAFVDIGPAARTLTALADVDTPAVSIANARGAPLPRTAVGWTSDDQAVARVNAQGFVTAVDTGTTWIRATGGFFTDSVQYTIQNLPTSIVVGGRTVDTLTGLGQALVYPVTVRNRRNAVIPNAPVSWRSTDRTVVDTVQGDTAVAVGFGGTLLIAQAAAGVEDTAALAVVNLTRLVVDNSVVVPAGTPRTGTGGRPYARIQDAVDAADANDTVFVRRGLGSYAETVALTKRLTLLGDSGSTGAASTFLGSNRNPSFLPLIAHDTGSAGITAITTAPQTIRYLAVRHTLDGPALEADGSDVTVEYFYVNPAGGSRIGRGLSVRNSPSGTGIRRSAVRSVRGYGIRLENVQGATIFSDSVIGVDSVAGSEEGAAVRIVGGGSIILSSNLMREAQGPLVSADGSTGLSIVFNQFFGRQTQVRLDNVAGSAQTAVVSNTFDLNPVTGNDNLVSANDGRAGLLIQNTNFTGTSLFVGTNTFTGPPLTNVLGWQGSTIDAIRLADARLVIIQVNTFRSVRYALRTQNATASQLFRAVADSVSGLLSAEGLDTLTLTSDTVRVAAGNCIIHPATVTVGGVAVAHDEPSSIIVTTSRFDRCSAFSGAGGAISVQSPAGATPDLNIQRSAIVNLPLNAYAIYFQGGDFSADSNVLAASTVPGDTARNGGGSFAALQVERAVTAYISRNAITDFHRRAGASLAATTDLKFGANRITRNGSGFHFLGDGSFGNTLAITACATCGGRGLNAVFDNDTLGFSTLGGLTGTFPDSIWWGDGRGPRSGGFATGDSVLAGGITLTHADAPPDTGTAAAALRLIRGNGTTAPAGTAALPQLTVRVVDAAGRPVPGVSVTFTVTAGGGSFAGPSSVAVVSNADGLAEANLTLGAAPGTNTVTVTGTALPLGTVTFSLTGT